MTQEDKELLLKDICARLPYNLYVRVEEFNAPKDEAITEGFIGNYLKDNRCNDYDADEILNELADDCINVKPFLRSLSSMIKEESEKYRMFIDYSYNDFTSESTPCVYVDKVNDYLDWLNAHHFDYRGLIEKNLALEAPDGIYNLKEK